MMQQTLRRLVRSGTLHVLGRLTPKRPENGVRFLFGHSMSAGDVPHFGRTLRALRNSFEFVSVPDAVRLLRDGHVDGRFLCFSFDDGYRSKYDYIAPTLRDFGATACFFIATNLVGGEEATRRRILRERVPVYANQEVMTWDMVRALADSGFTIGCHTLDHVDLGTVDLTEGERQVLSSKREVEAQLGRPCEFFAWPRGLQRHFPPGLLPRVATSFTAIFSAIRSRSSFSYDNAVINRDHFEPDWPVAHVRYFVGRSVSPDPDRGSAR